MVRITNGQMTLVVPTAAYRTIYARSGFHLIEDDTVVVPSADTFNAHVAKAPEGANFTEETEDLDESEYTDADGEDEDEIDLSEIPLSEMDFYQLNEYADQLGLDHKGMRSKKELRALIKANT